MAEAAVIKRLTDGAEGLSNGRLGHLRAGETPVEGWSKAGGGGERLAGMDEGTLVGASAARWSVRSQKQACLCCANVASAVSGKGVHVPLAAEGAVEHPPPPPTQILDHSSAR